MATTTRKLNGMTVRVIRELQGRGVRDLAAQLEINPGFLTRLETGTRQPSPAVMMRMAEALGVPVGVISYPVLVEAVAA